jgi:hypothetical protein
MPMPDTKRIADAVLPGRKQERTSLEAFATKASAFSRTPPVLHGLLTRGSREI